MGWWTRLLGAVRVGAADWETPASCSVPKTSEPCLKTLRSLLQCDRRWGQSLETLTGKQGERRDSLDLLSKRSCSTLWWLGLSQARVQGRRAWPVSGMLSLWGREWIATTEKNQFPNLLLLIFTWQGSCERALGVTCYSTSPCGFPCLPIATAHIWAWRQRGKSSLPHSCIVLQQVFRHRGGIQLLKPSLVLPFGTLMFIQDTSLEPAGRIRRDQTLLEQQWPPAEIPCNISCSMCCLHQGN